MICAGEQYYYYFEKLAKKQVQIYQDACDYGIKLNEVEKLKAREALKELREIYKNKVDFYGSKKSSWGSETEMFIPFEQDQGMYCGVKLKVDYHFDKSKKIEFITIEFKRHIQKECGYKN
jgi:hypothetical protein